MRKLAEESCVVLLSIDINSHLFQFEFLVCPILIFTNISSSPREYLFYLIFSDIKYLNTFPADNVVLRYLKFLSLNADNVVLRYFQFINWIPSM